MSRLAVMVIAMTLGVGSAAAQQVSPNGVKTVNPPGAIKTTGTWDVATRAGDLLIVANSFCYGAYIAVSKDIVRRYSALNVITCIFVIASIATIPAGVYSLSKISVSEISIGVWLAVAYIIILPTAGAYFLNAWALARVPPVARCLATSRTLPSSIGMMVSVNASQKTTANPSACDH